MAVYEVEIVRIYSIEADSQQEAVAILNQIKLTDNELPVNVTFTNSQFVDHIYEVEDEDDE